jgi:hypothetical protein
VSAPFAFSNDLSGAVRAASRRAVGNARSFVPLKHAALAIGAIRVAEAFVSRALTGEIVFAAAKALGRATDA